jgi:hypothetical protein
MYHSLIHIGFEAVGENDSLRERFGSDKQMALLRYLNNWM